MGCTACCIAYAYNKKLENWGFALQNSAATIDSTKPMTLKVGIFEFSYTTELLEDFSEIFKTKGVMPKEPRFEAGWPQFSDWEKSFVRGALTIRGSKKRKPTLETLRQRCIDVKKGETLIDNLTALIVFLVLSGLQISDIPCNIKVLEVRGLCQHIHFRVKHCENGDRIPVLNMKSVPSMLTFVAVGELSGRALEYSEVNLTLKAAAS